MCSVDAFERLLEAAERAPGLDLFPQGDRPPLEAASLRKAILFDHPFGAGAPAAWVGSIAGPVRHCGLSPDALTPASTGSSPCR